MCVYTYVHVTIIMTYTYSRVTLLEEKNMLQRTAILTNVLFYKETKKKLWLSAFQKNLVFDNLGHVINCRTDSCLPNWMRSALIKFVLYI